MKTKEEVIKALELCADPEGRCDGCPYDENADGSCMNRAMRDAAELLKKAVEPLVIERVEVSNES